MKSLIAPLLVAVLAAGCTIEISGAGGGGTETPAASTTTETTRPTTTTTTTTATTTTVNGPAALDGVPVDEYPSLPSQFCEQFFPGALGKPMLAVVVETPAGRVNCDQAGAILFDYYVERSDPKTGLPPLMIGPMECNQVREGILPQVVCADEDNLLYSIWPQI